MRLLFALTFIVSGCSHSYVRPVADVKASGEDYAVLLAKKRWDGKKVLQVRRDLEFEARIVRPEGEQVVAGQILGGSASQNALVVDLGEGPNALPTTWLRRMKVTDPTFRDKGRIMATALGAGYGFVFVGLPLGVNEILEGTASPAALAALTLPTAIGAGVGWIAGTVGTKPFYVVDFESDTWDWTFADP